MIRFTRRLDTPAPPTHTLTLTLEQRVRSRLRVTLDDGSPAGLFLERGHILRDGDCVAGDDGVVAEVRAAAETCRPARCDDPCISRGPAITWVTDTFHCRSAGTGALSRHDHVLDAMVRGLGLSVTVEHAPFEPEWGAYSDAQTHGDAHGHTIASEAPLALLRLLQWVSPSLPIGGFTYSQGSSGPSRRVGSTARPRSVTGWPMSCATASPTSICPRWRGCIAAGREHDDRALWHWTALAARVPRDSRAAPGGTPAWTSTRVAAGRSRHAARGRVAATARDQRCGRLRPGGRR